MPRAARLPLDNVKGQCYLLDGICLIDTIRGEVMGTEPINRLIVCWFKAILKDEHDCSTNKFRKKKYKYPEEYKVAHREMYQSREKKNGRSRV